MSDFSYEQVRHLAKLACIALSEEEMEKFKRDLQEVLDAVLLISDIDTDGMEPTTNPLSLPQHMRSDAPGKVLDRRRLLEQAPDCEDGMFVAPKILGDE